MPRGTRLFTNSCRPSFGLISARTMSSFLPAWPKASGSEALTREDIPRLDRTGEKPISNEEWRSRVDADAPIRKSKDGRTHMTHKAEHAMGMEVVPFLRGNKLPSAARKANRRSGWRLWVNQERAQGESGYQWLRKHGELAEPGFAQRQETGGLGRGRLRREQTGQTAPKDPDEGTGPIEAL